MPPDAIDGPGTESASETLHDLSRTIVFVRMTGTGASRPSL